VPPENLKALKKVAEKVDIPVATGERIHDRIEFRELFEDQSVDVIQPGVGHIGGIWETRRLAATAETHYTLVAPHNVGG
ncbi:enolase C-terminal domain-like protein, partial [Leucobacter sp. M11]|uniref:enolase C-terminal domain-like protein n=1 Tax=Leucobacter sp. M11 TaxID=2993565 RepID=UPI002D8037E4